MSLFLQKLSTAQSTVLGKKKMLYALWHKLQVSKVPTGNKTLFIRDFKTFENSPLIQTEYFKMKLTYLETNLMFERCPVLTASQARRYIAESLF